MVSAPLHKSRRRESSPARTSRLVDARFSPRRRNHGGGAAGRLKLKRLRGGAPSAGLTRSGLWAPFGSGAQRGRWGALGVPLAWIFRLPAARGERGLSSEGGRRHRARSRLRAGLPRPAFPWIAQQLQKQGSGRVGIDPLAARGRRRATTDYAHDLLDQSSGQNRF